MWALPRRISKLGLIILAAMGAAGITYWATDFGTNSPAVPNALPAEDAPPPDAFAMRFPISLNEAGVQPAWAMPVDEQMALFSPHSTYPVTTANATAPTERNANRRQTVFNDAQIASIKRRLKLTKDQEKYWPAVEAMLRDLAWKKTATDPSRQAAPATNRRLAALDMNSADLQRLKSTADPLLMSLNQDQKRELQMLAHLVGLQNEIAWGAKAKQ